MLAKVKKKKVASIIIIVVFAGYAVYSFSRSEIEEWKRKKEATERAALSFPKLCEAGQWIGLPRGSVIPKGEAYQAKIKLVKKGDWWGQETGEAVYVSTTDLPLDYFGSRDVEIAGIETGKLDGHEIFVSKLRCVGEETSREFALKRRHLMDYVSRNINTLSSIRSQSGWKAREFYFANESEFYVEYVDSENDREVMQWLARASKLDRSKPVIESLAYFKINPDNGQKYLVKGEDALKDVKFFSSYIFNSKTKQWEIQ